MSPVVSPLALSLSLLKLLCQFHFLWPDFKLYFPQISINSPLFFSLCISPLGWSDPSFVHVHCYVMTNKSLSSALTNPQHQTWISGCLQGIYHMWFFRYITFNMAKTKFILFHPKPALLVTRIFPELFYRLSIELKHRKFVLPLTSPSSIFSTLISQEISLTHLMVTNI